MLICWLDPMSLNIEKKAREPRPYHVHHKHEQVGIVHGTLFLYYFLHFRLQESCRKSIPVDVFASMLPGSNFPKISKA